MFVITYTDYPDLGMEWAWNRFVFSKSAFKEHKALIIASGATILKITIDGKEQ